MGTPTGPRLNSKQFDFRASRLGLEQYTCHEHRYVARSSDRSAESAVRHICNEPHETCRVPTPETREPGRHERLPTFSTSAPVGRDWEVEGRLVQRRTGEYPPDVSCCKVVLRASPATTRAVRMVFSREGMLLFLKAVRQPAITADFGFPTARTEIREVRETKYSLVRYYNHGTDVIKRRASHKVTKRIN